MIQTLKKVHGLKKEITFSNVINKHDINQISQMTWRYKDIEEWIESKNFARDNEGLTMDELHRQRNEEKKKNDILLN